MATGGGRVRVRAGGQGLQGRRPLLGHRCSPHRLARATAAARAKAWAAVVDRHGQLPAVQVAGTDLTRPAHPDKKQPAPRGALGLGSRSGALGRPAPRQWLGLLRGGASTAARAGQQGQPHRAGSPSARSGKPTGAPLARTP